MVQAIGGKVARAIVTTSVSQVAVIVLSFATSIAQARLLGSEGRGEVARFANAGALVVLYFGLGIGSAITFFVASGSAEPRAFIRRLWRVFWLTVVAVPIATVIVAATPLQRFLPQGAQIGWVVASLTAFFAVSQAGAWLSGILAARGVFNPINLSSIVVSGLGAAGSGLLLWLSPSWADAWTIIALTIGLEGVRTAMLAWSLVRGKALRAEGRSEDQPSRTGGPGLFEIWRYSLLTFLADALQFLSYRLDMWVVDAYHGASELGRYALAVSLAQLVWIVPAATARVLFPYAAMLERADGAALAWRAAGFALVTAVICAVGGWMASELLVTSLFGKDFADVPSLIGILVLGVVPFAVAKVLGNYLSGTNAVGANAMSTVAILFVAIGLDFLLIPTMGATGAAWATAISYSLHTLILVAIFRRKTAVPLRSVLSLRDPKR